MPMDMVFIYWVNNMNESLWNTFTLFEKCCLCLGHNLRNSALGWVILMLIKTLLCSLY